MDLIKVSDNLQRQMEHLPDVTDTVSIWGEKSPFGSRFLKVIWQNILSHLKNHIFTAG